MDWISLKRSGREYLQKYRYVLLVLLAGILLMCLPTGGTEPDTQQPQAAPQPSQPELQDALAELLSQIAGAGEVRVLLTQAAGEQTLYQTDEDISNQETSSQIRRETVLVSGDTQTGLIRQILPPSYRGAIVLCQGADNAQIRLSIVQAVANATGLTSDKITVLKMK